MSRHNSANVLRRTGRSLSRREFLALAGAGAATLVFPDSLAAQRPVRVGRRPPNVILIVADDLGYADLSCQGCHDIPTPQIDSLAKNGVRFTSGYVSCPVCSPTRAGLLTGRYQQRFGHEFNPGGPRTASEAFGLPVTEKTLADRLKAEGYVTGMVGKWHLGYRPGYRPTDRGFDEFFGFLGGGHSYLDTSVGTADPIRRGATPVEEESYLTDAFTREAVAFIDRHKSEPFFLYLPYNAVHTPMHASEQRWDRFAHIADERRRTFATMLAAVDDGMGAILDVLRRAGLYDNTLMVFISDNGGPTKNNTSRNDPLSGYKGQVLEGGIRVPFIIQWPSRTPGHPERVEGWKQGLPAGKVYEQPVIALDVVPTVVAAAGGTMPADGEVDGVNLLPHLRGESTRPPHDALFWRMGRQSAVRAGDWKLVKRGDGPAKLYNLASDVGETTDLAGEHPEKVRQLGAAYREWNSRNIEPLWRTQRSVRQERTGR